METRRFVCAKHGQVTPVAGHVKSVSGGKAAAGILTGGWSLLATGIRSKQGTALVCPKCKKPVAEAP